jgi:hypothetical protein
MSKKQWAIGIDPEGTKIEVAAFALHSTAKTYNPNPDEYRRKMH